MLKEPFILKNYKTNEKRLFTDQCVCFLTFKCIELLRPFSIYLEPVIETRLNE